MYVARINISWLFNTMSKLFVCTNIVTYYYLNVVTLPIYIYIYIFIDTVVWKWLWLLHIHVDFLYSCWKRNECWSWEYGLCIDPDKKDASKQGIYSNHLQPSLWEFTNAADQQWLRSSSIIFYINKYICVYCVQLVFHHITSLQCTKFPVHLNS